MHASRGRWLAALAAMALAWPLAAALDARHELALRRASAALATALLNLSGLRASRSDTTIVTPSARFEVLRPCAGGKFLAASVALGAGLAILGTAAWPRRLAVLALAAPLALAGNALRVTALVRLDQPAWHAWLGVLCFGLVAANLTALSYVARAPGTTVRAGR